MTNEVSLPDSAESGATRRKLLSGLGVAAAGGGLLALTGGQTAQADVAAGTYYSDGPTRFLDTRESGGKISSGQTRTLTNFDESDQLAFAINLTVVSTEGSGYLAIYNADRARPTPYSSINWKGAGQIVANFNVVDGGEAGLNIYCSVGPGVRTHFIIDVVGVFDTSDVTPPANVKAWQQKVKKRLGHS